MIHYAFEVPADARGPITIDAALRYRKFDSRFLRFVEGEGYSGNHLPIATLATGSSGPAPGWRPRDPGARPTLPPPEGERWNDYGIGLLREAGETGKQGGLRQAAATFSEVERLGRAGGPLNLARVYFREGELDAAAKALERATQMEPPAPPWVRCLVLGPGRTGTG